MAENHGVLGVFDSGVGGLSVVRAMLQQLPAESILYVADSANCPYGLKTADDITRFSAGISRYLIGRGAKAVVVACNTASAAALVHLRRMYPTTPFIGMVPAVKPAAQLTRSGVVGVLATTSTLDGQLFGDVVTQYAAGVRVLSSACPGLVEMIEAGELEGDRLVHLLRSCIDPLINSGADTLVLGCTHYPFIIPALSRLYGKTLQVLEPSDAVARQVAHVLAEHALLAPADGQGEQTYLSTGDPESLSRAVQRFLGGQGAAGRLDWVGDELAARGDHAETG